MSKIGIYSGSFDPIHVGHVEFALAAKKECGLDKVVFLPEANPREKVEVSDIRLRSLMIGLGVEAYPGLELLYLNQDRFSVSLTLPRLYEQFPGAELVLLLGSDLVRTFSYRWEGLGELLATMELAVGLRMGDSAEEISHTIEAVAHDYGVKARYKIIKSPREHLASTQVRSGTHYIDDVNPKVAEYIKAQGLYDSDSSAVAGASSLANE